MADQFGCAFLIRSFPFKLHVFQIPWPGRKMLSNICETLWTYTFLPFAIIRRMLNWVVVHRIKNDTNRPKVATTVVVFRSIRLLVGELREAYPISTLPEHLHSTFPSYAKIPENTLTEKKSSFSLFNAHYLFDRSPQLPHPLHWETQPHPLIHNHSILSAQGERLSA